MMKDVTYRIRLYDPNRDSEPHWEAFTIPYAAGMTVLDGLWKVKELHAPGLAWRASCRMGVCGSCGMLINGKPGRPLISIPHEPHTPIRHDERHASPGACSSLIFHSPSSTVMPGGHGIVKVSQCGAASRLGSYSLTP